MNDSAKQIAGSLLQIKAIKLNPTNHFTWASGWYSPIYCDNRKILSYPAVRKQVYEAFADLIAEKYPEYSAAFTKVCNRTWAHMFNMFVMRRDLFDQYCEWMFSILEEIEKRVDISDYDTYEARIYGFVSEILLDVWIEANNISYKEQNVSFMEPQNWIKKGGLFLKRKLFGR